MRIRLPPLNTKAQTSVTSDYEDSFKIRASKLWNLLPKQNNTLTTLDQFKAELGGFIDKYPDTPPVTGYTASNRNSLLDWQYERRFYLGRTCMTLLSGSEPCRTYINRNAWPSARC